MTTIKTEELQRTLNDEGNVNVVTVATVPHYEGHIYASQGGCTMLVDSIKENCDIWCARSREGFEVLNTINDWEPEGESLQKDIESFQQYLDEKYGKDNLVAYALGAYIHSMVSFSISKSEDNRCRWDSGTCGFIGIPNNMVDQTRQIAENLSNGWNGEVYEYQIWDNLKNDMVDYEMSYGDIKGFMKRAQDEFGIDFSKLEVVY